MSVFKLQFLGTGNARGVPVYGCSCPACERAQTQPEFNREEATVLLEVGGQHILIDAGLTDLHQRFKPGDLDRIIMTHYHVDHGQGLFALRWGLNDHIPVIGPEEIGGCIELLQIGGILDFSQKAHAFETLHFDDLAITPLPLTHNIQCFGYEFVFGGKRFSYLTDTSGLPETTREYLLKNTPAVMVLDCNTPPDKPIPTAHNNTDMALQIHHDIQPEQTILTHIGHDLDSWLMQHDLNMPDNVSISFDGMSLSF